MERRYRSGDQWVRVQVEPAGQGYAVTVGEQAFAVTAEARTDELRLTVAGQTYAVPTVAEAGRRWIFWEGQAFVFEPPPAETTARRAGGHGAQPAALEAQMPGVVRQVLTAVGETVERGQALLVLEAMKMEIRIAAPQAGVVARLGAQAGETVQRGQILIELAPPA